MKKAVKTIKSIRTAFLEGLKELYEADEINSITYILFEEFLGWPKTKLHIEPFAIVEESDADKFSDALNLLAQGCPIQYVTGKTIFNGLTILVNPAVLIPRPETAELAEILVRDLGAYDLQNFSAFDIGTGSGCLAIYIKKQFPVIRMHGTDISEDALATAKANANLNATEIDFFRSDILIASETLAGSVVNLIVSNPPYVTIREKEAMMKNVTDYEPLTALFVPDEDPLLYYRAICRYAQHGLAKNGLLYLEINEAYGNELKQLLNSEGFGKVNLIKDFRGRDRFIKAEFRNHL
ncbi:MAG: peptide chain release factor N(5)-glutamine methyltransferase [Bacteroidetes bacterium]|nr:peptide chain release factor N(5)-glutamine methyltransferase [Bacteroidota bacterium]